MALQSVTIYTDGSCSGNPGPGGWAALLQAGGYTKELSGGAPSTTNNRMELQAVIEALRALKYPCKIELHSDSSSCFRIQSRLVEQLEKTAGRPPPDPKSVTEICGRSWTVWPVGIK